MANVSQSFSFTVENDPTCWHGLASYFETKLLRPLPYYALEQLRLRFLFAVTTTHDGLKGARAVLQMAFDTEVGAVLAKSITLAPDVLASTVCERRRFLDIDIDMRLFGFLIEPALTAAEDNAVLPAAYLRLIRAHLQSPYARYRVCAIAGLLCLATAQLIPDIKHDYTLAFAEAVTVTDSKSLLDGLGEDFYDTVSVADLFTIGKAYFRTAADTATVADAKTTAKVTQVVKADTVSVTEGITRNSTYTLTKSDTPTVADTYVAAGPGYGFYAGIDTSNLKCWLKADVGVTMNGSNQVSRWADQSEHANDFVAISGTGSLQPVWASNQKNSLPGITFANGGLVNTTPFISGASAGEIFLVIIGPAAGTGANHIGFGTATLSGADNQFPNGSNNVLEGFGDSDRWTVTPAGAGFRTWCVYNVAVQLTSNTYSVDQSLRRTVTTGVIAWGSTFTIGTRNDTVSTNFNGYIGEVIVGSGVWSSGDRTAIANALKARWNTA